MGTDETGAYCCAAAATWTRDRLPGGLSSLHKKCSLCLELMQADERRVICSRWQKLATGGIKQCYRLRGFIITLALQRLPPLFTPRRVDDAKEGYALFA